MTALVEAGSAPLMFLNSPFYKAKKWPTIVQLQRQVSQRCSGGRFSNYRVSAGFTYSEIKS